MRVAKQVDKTLVVDILCSAFEPLVGANSINYVVLQDEKRSERMRILMEYLFDRSMRYGTVYISDNNKASLLVSYPNREKVTLGTIHQDLRLAFKCIGAHRVFSVLRRQRIIKSLYPTKDYVTPVIMGVMRSHQGRGTAVRLMLKVRDSVEDNHLPAIIDAASKANVSMYKKFGFKVFKRVDSLGFPIWFLRLN